MKNIHILPTNKQSRLFYNVGGALLFTKWYNYNGVHIYITSDEEIKERDWCLHRDGKGIICEVNLIFENGDLLLNNATRIKPLEFKKIILTTDQDLIEDGVQAIDDEFLEWFVKNPSCERVEVIKNWNYPLDKRWEYKINFIVIKEDTHNQNALYFEIDALKREVKRLNYENKKLTETFNK